MRWRVCKSVRMPVANWANFPASRSRSWISSPAPASAKTTAFFVVHVAIFDWTDRDVYEYLRRYELPYHPLWHDGYVSIGDWHSTRTLAEAGDDEEATRFFGLKRECGLHGLEG